MEIITPIHLNPRASVNAPATKHVDVQNTSPVIEKGLVLDPSLDVYQQGAQLALQLGAPVDEAPFSPNVISGNFDDVKEQYRLMMMAMKRSSDQFRRIPQPVEDGRSHIEATQGLIEKIHGDYQKTYGEIVKASTKYMQDVNTALGKLSDSIKSGSDGKIHFTPKKFMVDFDLAISKYSGISYSDYESFYTSSSYTESQLLTEYCEMWGEDLGKKNPTDQNTHSKNKMRDYLSTLDSSEYGTKTPPLYTIKAGSDINVEFSFWEKKLSGQGFTVKKSGNEIQVYPDFKPIREILLAIKNSPAGWSGEDVMAQQFQSLQTAIDAQKNSVNSSVSRLLETFRQDNSHFDTLVQLLIQLIKDLNQNNNGLINM